MINDLSRPARGALTGHVARSIFTTLLLAAALASPWVMAQPRLDFDAALRLAQQRSRQLPAQDAAAAAARDMAVAAGERPDPVFKASLSNLPVDGPARFNLAREAMTMRSVGLMQEFTRDDKRQVRRARFEREADLAQAGRLQELADLRRETALAWLDRHYQQRWQALLANERSEAVLQLDAADAAYRGGRGASADLLAARSAVAQIDDRMRVLQRDLATATTRLFRWVGEDANLPLGDAPDLSRLPAGLSLPAGLPQTLAAHPRLQALARREALAQAAAEVARSEQRPDWSVELMFSQRGSAYSNMVSLNLSLPWQMNQGNRQDRELSARLALVERERAERDEALRDLVAETDSMVQTWRIHQDRLLFYDQILLPLATERTQAALAVYRGGTSSLGVVLEARRKVIDVRAERLRIEMESAALWARLETLIPIDTATGDSK